MCPHITKTVPLPLFELESGLDISTFFCISCFTHCDRLFVSFFKDLEHITHQRMSTTTVATLTTPSTAEVGASIDTNRRSPLVAATTARAAAAASITATKSKKKKVVSMSTTMPRADGSGENTGRWTAEEHLLFLQGLEQYGKGWKKIACLIKSRTVVQIRTHAQKYFQKVKKAKQNGEKGDISMVDGSMGLEDGVDAVLSSSGQEVAPSHAKRRRVIAGTKRKTIPPEKPSVERKVKRLVGQPTLPSISPHLARFIMPPAGGATSSHSAQGTVSGPYLEDSL